MKVIGIDPGKTIGLCLYNGLSVIEAHECKGETAILKARDVIDHWVLYDKPEAIAIEWPRIYSKAGNDVADTCIQTGMLWWLIGARTLPTPGHTVQWISSRSVHLHPLTRSEIVKALSDKMGQQVKTDAGVWAALMDLHGGKGVADKKFTKAESGGPLGELRGKPHARAALAAAWVIASSST